MLEQCYSTNGEQAADREERPLVPVYARKVAVAPAGPNLQATIRKPLVYRTHIFPFLSLPFLQYIVYTVGASVRTKRSAASLYIVHLF